MGIGDVFSLKIPGIPGKKILVQEEGDPFRPPPGIGKHQNRPPVTAGTIRLYPVQDEPDQNRITPAVAFGF